MEDLQRRVATLIRQHYLRNMHLDELRTKAREYGINGFAKMNKAQLVRELGERVENNDNSAELTAAMQRIGDGIDDVTRLLGGLQIGANQ